MNAQIAKINRTRKFVGLQYAVEELRCGCVLSSAASEDDM